MDILHPDDIEVAKAMLHKMITSDISMDGLFRYRCKDGQWRTFETWGKTLVQDGEIVGVVTVGRDITDRLQMEQKLQKYQEQLEFLAFHDALTGLPNRTLFFDRTDSSN